VDRNVIEIDVNGTDRAKRLGGAFPDDLFAPTLVTTFGFAGRARLPE
jgi:hypothetical protein